MNARLVHERRARRYVALRGDDDGSGELFWLYPDSYASSLDLIAWVRELGAKDISVAAYPNGYPDSCGPDTDLDFLKQKCDADPDVRRQVAVATAMSLCERLDANDVRRIHVYSCNQAEFSVATARVPAFPVSPTKAT